MSVYRKRAKGSWNVGKGHKHEEGAERQFSKRECQQQLDADEEDYLEKHHKGGRTKNERARLEYRIKWYEDAIERHGQGMGLGWLGNGLRDAKEALKKLDENEAGKVG